MILVTRHRPVRQRRPAPVTIRRPGLPSRPDAQPGGPGPAGRAFRAQDGPRRSRTRYE
jgi:hypothetical protein